jgi:hypothetical protein
MNKPKRKKQKAPAKGATMLLMHASTNNAPLENRSNLNPTTSEPIPETKLSNKQRKKLKDQGFHKRFQGQSKEKLWDESLCRTTAEFCLSTGVTVTTGEDREQSSMGSSIGSCKNINGTRHQIAEAELLTERDRAEAYRRLR